MKLLSALILAALLAGCASAPQPARLPEHALFDDAAFKAPDDLVTPEQLFALTPEMKAFAARIRHTRGDRYLHEALFDALRSRDQLRLEYDSEITRTAAQAFEARSGNCMALVIMTAAFARELGLQVHYQHITSDSTWSRNGSLYFSNGHVNLLLGKTGFEPNSIFDRSEAIIVDFLSPPEADRLPAEIIRERTIVAMYMNNRAAESMAQAKLDDAYWWVRRAIDHDPDFLPAYNTLAAVYQRHGTMEMAERALRFAHRHDRHNKVILFNLSEVVGAAGKKEEAAMLKAELARLEPYPQFHFFHLGQQAMAQGDFRKARSLFAREVKRAPYYHEFHFWMAKAALAMGELNEADKHLELALSNSTTRGDSAIYASKLAKLRIGDLPRPARQ